MSVILGLNAFHGDASAALVIDGRLSAAAEEERFRRIKHWAGFPAQAASWCLQQAGLSAADVDVVALNSDGRAQSGARLRWALTHPNPRQWLERIRHRSRRADAATLMREQIGAGFSGEVVNVEHHLAHLAAAYLVSPYEDAVCVSVDGFGDFSSAAWGVGQGGDIHVDHRVLYPHSLGIFYETVTHYLGFKHYGDEYKVMGLAPYGKPSHVEQMMQLLRLQPDGGFELNLDYFRHHRLAQPFTWDNGQPSSADFFNDRWVALFGPPRDPSEPLEQRHRDLARSAQQAYETALFHLLNALHGRYGVDRLVLSGGCAMNSVANGKVLTQTPFTDLYVQPAAGDSGGALGAAAWVAHSRGEWQRPQVMNRSDWGPAFEESAVSAVLDAAADELADKGCRRETIADEARLADEIADALAQGAVVGWFQGGMEWGPRALGHRSILADPRRADMRELLNLKIKRRESFRPFAPAILREAVNDWFEVDAEVPFMTSVFPIRPERHASIPAVTHVDGSGRLQTVTEAQNPRYHRLISAFAERTGVPILLNTSFNENEPVVCKPEEALDCFLRTHMDVLVMGNQVVRR